MSKTLDQYEKLTDLHTMQDMLRDLMQELHLICEANGLSYSLTDGTLLGAVRHQDIIPWDDDIDIIMPRPDFNKLIEIIQNEYSDKYTFFYYPKKNYIYPYGKFCKNGTILYENALEKKYSKLGLYIDVFPLDGLPEMSDEEMDALFAKALKYKRLTGKAAGKITPSPVWWKKGFVVVRWLYKLILQIFGYKYFLKKQIKLATRYSFEDCDTVGFIPPWIGGKKGLCDKQDYLDQQLYPFGKYQFWGMKNYDKKLTKLYGDYMTPPPPHQRTAPHAYDLYIKKDSAVK